jgi:hypothetical protein
MLNFGLNILILTIDGKSSAFGEQDQISTPKTIALKSICVGCTNNG